MGAVYQTIYTEFVRKKALLFLVYTILYMSVNYCDVFQYAISTLWIAVLLCLMYEKILHFTKYELYTLKKTYLLPGGWIKNVNSNQNLRARVQIPNT